MEHECVWMAHSSQSSNLFLSTRLDKDSSRSFPLILGWSVLDLLKLLVRHEHLQTLDNALDLGTIMPHTDSEETIVAIFDIHQVTSCPSRVGIGFYFGLIFNHLQSFLFVTPT